jgi:hypothetical protein
MEEVLDFYLDLQHHELLWKRYVKAMHRSGHLTEGDLADGYQSPRILSRLSYNSDEKRVESPPLMRKNNDNLSVPMPIPVVRPPLDDDEMSSAISTRQVPSRKDLVDSSQRLLLRYLVPSATKELTQLPPALKNALREELEKPGARDDPVLFKEAKDYLFEYMQRSAYPKFLRLKVWGNVTLHQQLGRLVIGLLCLLIALTTSLSLIFLGFSQWGVRFWVRKEKKKKERILNNAN